MVKASGLEIEKWEDVCVRCGRCCYEKYEYRGKIYYTDKPCEHLDTKTNLCRVYNRRSEIHPDCACLTPELVQEIDAIIVGSGKSGLT